MSGHELSPRDVQLSAIQAMGIEHLIGTSLEFDHAEGNELLYMCPDTQKPKLSINRSTGMWQSFTAATEGDLIALLMKVNRWEFPDALRYLCEAAGISLNGNAPSEQAYREQRRKLGVLTDATKLMVWALHESDAGAKVMRYLHERGYSTLQIQKMGLGWYGNRDWFEKKLIALGYTQEEVAASGIQEPSSMGTSAYSLAIPWRDRHSQVVGLSVRDITGTKEIKYWYNKGFNRGSYLLGLEHYKKGNLTLVEGQLDQGIMNAEGIAAAAIGQDKLGTEQLRQLIVAKVECVTLGLDQDKAGWLGTERAIAMLQKAGIPTVVARWGKAKDPDEVFRLDGVQTVQDYVDEPVSCGGWLATFDMRELDPRDLRSRETTLQRCHQRYMGLRESDPLGAADYIQAAASATTLPGAAVAAKIRGAVDSLNRGVVLASSVRPMVTTVNNVLSKIEHRLIHGEDPEIRHETGFEWLNQQMRSFQPSDLIVEQAGFNQGKSKLALWQCCQQVLAGTKVGYVSIDMEEVGLSEYAGVVMHNSICEPHLRIPWEDLLAGPGDEMHLARIRDTKRLIEKKFAGMFYECTVPKINLKELEEVEREMIRQGCSVIYLDQLELLDEYQEATAKRNYDAITGIMASQKAFANEFKYTKVIEHQITRAGFKGGNPNSRDSAGSDAVGRQTKFLVTFFDAQRWYCDEGKGYNEDEKTGLPKSPGRSQPQFTEPQSIRPVQIKLGKTRRGNTGRTTIWFDFAHGMVVPQPGHEANYMSVGAEPQW